MSLPWLPHETGEAPFHPVHCPGEEAESQRGTRPHSGSSALPYFLLPLRVAPAGLLKLSHLGQRALRLPHFDEDPEWNAYHRGQCHEPADAVAPGRVGVDIIVLEWLVLDQEEDEDTLQRERGSWGWPSALLNPHRPRPPCWSTVSVRQDNSEAHPMGTRHGDYDPRSQTPRGLGTPLGL